MDLHTGFCLSFFNLFFFYSFSARIMPHKSRANDLFGAPSNFSRAQLPTILEVGKQWRQCRLDLEAKYPGAKILNRSVAEEVRVLK